MRYVFKHEYRQNHSTLLDIIDILFTWIQKHSKETENRDTVVYRRWEDRFVRIRKKWSSFSLGVYGPSQNLYVLTYRARKNEMDDSQHRPNQIKQISFGVSVEHPTRKHGLKHPCGVYSSKYSLKFLCVSRENLRATLFWPGPLRFQGYWPEWRPSTEVNF